MPPSVRFAAVIPIPAQTIVAAWLAVKCNGNIPIGATQLWLGNPIQKHLPLSMLSIPNTMETSLPGLGSACLLGVTVFLLARGFAMIFPRDLPEEPKLPIQKSCKPISSGI